MSDTPGKKILLVDDEFEVLNYLAKSLERENYRIVSAAYGEEAVALAKNEKPVFNYDLCVACGICLHACAFGSLEMNKVGVDKLKKAYPTLMHPDTCVGCEQCEQQCPVGAVVVR